jgi:membrane fusion protein, copper/silver efflux system
MSKTLTAAAGRTIALGIVLAGGVALGVTQHARIGRWLGIESASEPQASREAKKDGRLWTCGMHPQVVREEPGLCPICHMELTPMAAETTGNEPRASEGMAGKERKVAYWWDPMLNPPYISDRPGKSPMGLDLIPVYEDEVSAGSGVTIDPVVVQNMGLRTEVVTQSNPVTTVRAVGYVRAAEPRTYDVTVKFSGWIERLHADTEGMKIEEGAPLFDLYSPDLLVAQAELQSARRAADRLPPTADAGLRRESERMVELSRRKLALWDLSDDEVGEIEKATAPRRTVTVRSRVVGTLVEKAVVQGARVEPGARVLQVADLSTVWIDAKVPDAEIAGVAAGQEVRAAVRAYPDRSFSGRVEFVHPQVEAATRTVAVRLSVANTDGSLKPGMYATAELVREGGSAVTVVPREAVIDTGTRQIAFVERAKGRFDPREVAMGREAGDGRVEVLRGLAPGETVVVSGQFLLEAESRTREAIRKMLDAKRSVPTPAAPTAPQEPPTEMIEAGHVAREASSLTRAFDAVTVAYLDLVSALAADDEKGASGHVKALVAASTDLEKASKETPDAAAATSLQKGASALSGKDVAGQRKALPELGRAFLVFADRVPPSSAVGKALYVFHCSMFPGDWVQRTDRVANPFYGKEMPTCGSLLRKFEPTSSG